MAIPEQIRKQSEDVKKLYAELNSETGGAKTPDAKAPTNDAAAPAADAQSATNDATPPNGNEQTPAGGNNSREPGEDFEQKYKTLQGMYNREVPTMRRQNQELAVKVQQMEQLLAALSEQQNNATRQQPAAPVEKLVTDKDVEEYGESIDMMRKVSREEVAPVMQRLSHIERLLGQIQTNVVPQVQAVAQRQHMSAEQKFWADLGSMVPNWRAVNDDPDFQNWLLSPDPFTGITRQTYLDAAQREMAAERVAAFFTTWLDQTGKSNVARNDGRNQQPASTELEKQVAPGRARSAAPPQQQQSKSYSREDIAAFFNDVRSGKYKGREAERDKIERDIFAAQRDGRISA